MEHTLHGKTALVTAAGQGIGRASAAALAACRRLLDKRFAAAVEEYQEALLINEDRPVFLRVYKPSRQGHVFIAVPR